ncbi:hypothetical protein [Streptomyces sp. CB03911]|uniref:hypothetical protein n=1 Tax=Streptomycetaceae TaxID=2062 RepID=UPI00093FDB35|nr:hypothetical protein [Streptomyces sp. CB03911]OKI20916.1 hypothetical protein A6A07_36190 [Streptomyces sp. CB03911]
MKPRTAVTVVAVAMAAFTVTAPAAVASGSKVSQATAASQFRNAGITWSSSGNCTTRSNSTCTSFEQINSGTVSTIITLKQSSGCAINITGGTEVGHASGTYSHYNGYKVDVSRNSCIDGYVQNSFTYIGYRGDGYPQWKAASGNLYCNEGNHWDITVY